MVQQQATTQTIVLKEARGLIRQLLNRSTTLEARLEDCDELDKTLHFTQDKTSNHSIAYILKDYFIQLAMEDLLLGYNNDDNWSVQVRVGHKLNQYFKQELMLLGMLGQITDRVEATYTLGNGKQVTSLMGDILCFADGTTTVENQGPNEGETITLHFKGIKSKNDFIKYARNLVYKVMRQNPYVQFVDPSGPYQFNKALPILDILSPSDLQKISQGGN